MAETLRGINGPGRAAPFSRWFRYPAGFSTDALRICLDRVPIRAGSLVVDPFAGAATGGIAVVSLGACFRGIEAHPLIAELANLKFGSPPPMDLIKRAKEVVESFSLGDHAVEHPMVQRCFDDGTLGVLAGLRSRIAEEDDLARPYLAWALTATLRDCADVKVGWPYQRPGIKRTPVCSDPRTRFMTRAGFIARDLAAMSGGCGKVVHGDSRQADSWTRALSGCEVDACITSPPYLNNFDYADATRLELYFLGRVSSWSEMCSEVRSTMMVASTQQTGVGGVVAARKVLVGKSCLVEDLDALVHPLKVEKAKRKGGKEYDRLLFQYFGDMSQVVANMAAHLKPGAKAAMVIGDSAPYGVYVDTPHLIGRLAECEGLVVDADVKVRDRGQRWASATGRHTVGLSERVLVLRKPSI